MLGLVSFYAYLLDDWETAVKRKKRKEAHGLSPNERERKGIDRDREIWLSLKSSYTPLVRLCVVC